MRLAQKEINKWLNFDRNQILLKATYAVVIQVRAASDLLLVGKRHGSLGWQTMVTNCSTD